MFKKWRLTDRTRMLLKLELAITLPAVALMAFSIWNLRHFQRDQAIEAAIQRDFMHVLKIAETKSWIKANQYLAPIRKEFPTAEDKDIKGKLDQILADHPELDYAIFYDKKSNTYVGRMQSTAPRSADFCSFVQSDFNDIQQWMQPEGAMFVDRIRMMEEEGEDPVFFYGSWEWKKEQHIYSNEAFFLPPGTPKGEVALGIVQFNQDYLQKTFFPEIMKDVLHSKSNAFRNDANPPAMMIHAPHDSAAWVVSAHWGDGKGEVDRPFSDIFQGMVMVHQISRHNHRRYQRQIHALQLYRSSCALHA